MLNIYHLLFTYNTLIFFEASPYHLRYLRCLFLCLEAVSSLRINLAKSELVPIGDVTNGDGLDSIMGCRVSCLLLRAFFKAKFFCDGIIEEMERRMVVGRGCTWLRAR